MAENITLRSHLLGTLTDFCESSELALLKRPLHAVELTVLLARYQEEGVALTPQVYVISSRKAVAPMLPESEFLKIGVTTADGEGLHEALKKWAPLASAEWKIYIDDSTNALEFGVFRGMISPISIQLDEVLLSASDDYHVVKLHQVAPDCVELRSNKGKRHYVFLNHRSEDSDPPQKYLNDLVDVISKKVEESSRESVESYINKVLTESLKNSHGCIIAVSSMSRPPKLLSADGIFFDQPIDFFSLVDAYRKGHVDSARLLVAGDLVRGMLQTDGIVVFDEMARVLGYNCFVKIPRKNELVGGARKRAFATLADRVGNGLSAAFIKSQDGWTEFKGKSNV